MTASSLDPPDPDRALRAALAAWRAGGPSRIPLRLRHERAWARPPTAAAIDVVYHYGGSPSAPTLAASVGGCTLPLDSPVALEPVVIPKPWGREVWYTGYEARGESRVVGAGGTMGLAGYLALAPEMLTGNRPVVLLKVLDPSPVPVLGELYLEVHEHKREVYVVTHVDAGAWPDGTGYIRFGMNQARRRAYADDDAFRAAFLEATRDYERCRRAADAGAGDAAAEAAARERVNDFSALAPLEVGDVVVVPTWVPHALQHGVRVVEFQTPSYERYILAFGQKVLTQDHWDSAAAIPRMSLDAPPAPAFEIVRDGVERIAEFLDFAVWRARLEPGAGFTLPAAAPYAVGMCVSGTLVCEGRSRGLRLDTGQAVFVPGPAIGCAITNPSDREPAIGLFAAPGL